MNWILLFTLSLFGLGMAIATVYLIPFKFQGLFWLLIFIFCAYMIAKKCNGKYFLHGFMLSLLNCVWIVGVHVLLFDAYWEQPEVQEMNADFPISYLKEHPKQAEIIIGPFFGIFFGLIIGLFSWIAS